MSVDLGEHYLCGVLGGFVRHVPAPVPPAGMDWVRLERVATRNLVLPIVLHAAGEGVVPTALRDRWHRLALGSELHYARARAAAVKVCGWLEDGGIPTAVMRGMALAGWVYPDAALRPMVDVDLLAPASARELVRSNLAGHGVEPALRLRSQLVYRIDGVVFEIHFHLLTPRRYRGLVDTTRWLDSRERSTGGAGGLWRLAPEHELVQLVCHSFMHHGIKNLLQLVDVALVGRLGTMDWPSVRQWVREAHLTRMFRFTLGLADALLGLDLAARLECGGPREALSPELLEAYRAPLLAADSRRQRLRRSLHLLHVAETPAVKAKQMIRFLSREHLGEFLCLRA